MSMAVNNSTFPANNTIIYVFAPVQLYIKIILATGIVILSVLTILPNVFIFYHSHRNTSKPKHIPMNRLPMKYFTQSLALSDILCCLVDGSLPVAELFVDTIQSEFICKFTRYIEVAFAVIIIFNCLVISIERFLGIFYPFFVINPRHCRTIIKASWVIGGLLATIMIPSYRLQRYDVDHQTYTFFCLMDRSKASLRQLFLIFIVINYIVPCFIIVVISIRIIYYLHHHN